MLEKHLGRKAVRKYIPVPPTGDVLATFADISSARKVQIHFPGLPLKDDTLSMMLSGHEPWFRYTILFSIIFAENMLRYDLASHTVIPDCATGAGLCAADAAGPGDAALL